MRKLITFLMVAVMSLSAVSAASKPSIEKWSSITSKGQTNVNIKYTKKTAKAYKGEKITVYVKYKTKTKKFKTKQVVNDFNRMVITSVPKGAKKVRIEVNGRKSKWKEN